MSAWPILIALAAALCYAVGSVLEQYEAAKLPDEHSMKLGLMTRLVQRPLWLLGFGLDGAGFALQALALSMSSVVIVQPLIAASIIFALPLGVRYTGQRLGWREWIGAAIVAAGIAGFVALADVSGGSSTAVPTHEWVIGSALVVGLALVAGVAGWRAKRPELRATLYGIVGGLMWGLMAVFLDTAVDLWGAEGFLHLLGTVFPYGVIVFGVTGLVAAQSAFQTGKLAPAMATFEALQPIVAVVLGVILFNQGIQGSLSAREFGAAVALGALVAGIFVLSRSRLVAPDAGASHPGNGPGGGGQGPAPGPAADPSS